MNKSALKTFATKARRELLKKVEARAMKIGITEDNIKKAEIESSDAIFIDGRQLSKEEKIQRNRLIDRVHEIGFKRVMEEVAYTWFNRFTALRFMEVNDYLPTKVRVLSSTYADSTEPDMMKEAFSLDLDIDKEYVYELKMNNQSEELFKYLIIKHCNDLNRYMPFMFETINDYTEILFPDGLLAPDSFVRQMANTEVISEDNWQHIEVIGWLYQYYIAEEKDRVFKEKKKYKAEEIPFATQLFTPDWIVRYMVQNSLGRYWVESHPEHHELTNGWEFYIEHEEEDFQEKIAPYVNKDLNVEDIKCLDPAMGSGHILVYAFDVFYEIYSKCGYMEKEIPRLILKNNLYGLDIDDRAYQLACFSVVMKAMKYNRRFLRSIEREGLVLNLASIQETNNWTDEDIGFIAGESSGKRYDSVKEFVEQYVNGKTYGSLIKATSSELSFLENRLNTIKSAPSEDLFQTEMREKVLLSLPKLIKQTEIMSRQYDVCIMNPPYMGLNNMNKGLSDFLKENYPNSKSDLFAAFMEVDHYIKPSGFYAAINQHSWMFLTSYESLRRKIIKNKSIINMLHLGPRTFEDIGGEVVQSTSFIIRNVKNQNGKGIYLRLINYKSANEKMIKVKEAKQNLSVSYVFASSQDDFKKIPGCPIGYWISKKIIDIFQMVKNDNKKIEAKVGLSSGNNNKYLRYWYEVEKNKISFKSKDSEEFLKSKCKWVPLNKGGSFRKWYGNNEYIIYWFKNGVDIKNTPNSTVRNEQYYFKECLTWSDVSTGDFSIRKSNKGFLFSDAGPCLFSSEISLDYLLALLNTKIVNYIMNIINPTMHYKPGNVLNIPIIENEKYRKEIEKLARQNYDISYFDWNSYETSWDFSVHPLMIYSQTKMEDAYKKWSESTETKFQQLKLNEEEINRIFLEIYGLEDELTPYVKNEKISIRKADLERDIKSFISYAIGCSLGRYSLDEEGLIYAGGEFDAFRYQKFPADKDNILPILPGAYFEPTFRTS
ncbi:BREX-1 system adenine-specific DNA-methyltransferase PglX, partial [Heyndrickxia faecalis]|uniref:BREX-1 system adenine-specific DNA-methyltransferase PglX n=1 Tax=Heyndrickxia faecalis TaxID=2824910 RepID=UPI003D1DEDDA